LTCNFFHFCARQSFIRMDVALYVSLSVTQYIFLFKKDASCVTTVVQLFLHFRLNIMKLKYKCYQCFHGNQLLKFCGMLKYKFSYFQKHALRSKATGIMAENSTNSTKSRKCRHLRYEENLIKTILCLFCNIPTLIKLQYDEVVTFHNILYL